MSSSSYCPTMCLPKAKPKARSSTMKLPGLPGAFFTWIRENPAFMDEMFRWQDANRHLFMGPTEEFPIQATIEFNNLMGLIDTYLAAFLSAQGLTEDDFSNVLEEFQASDNKILKMFVTLIAKKTEFMHWAMLVRENKCLCCGGGFREWPAAAQPTYAAGDTGAAPYTAEAVPAVASVDAGLPPGWMAHTDPATGKVFYQNLADGTTTWDHPGAVAAAMPPAAPVPLDLAAIQSTLPEGWTAYIDEASGRVFYACAADGATTWDPPVA
mmetsp:Transcript_47443/g.86865  ORF Transcript_47443/g.86865 Transcript_47443/m.86865 type:complete len:268 (-) Transcript_47443:28-831(-)